MIQAELSDGWSYPPFKLTRDEKTDRLYGRGSSDDKGPVLGWVNVLQAHHELNLPLPVNLRFCFEGMEESGSQGLDDLITSEVKKGKDGWFDGVDCVCISDNFWLNTRTPCITYGLRGITYIKMMVQGPAKDLHSGVFGRVVHEPMTDLVLLMGKLVDTKGNILIPGVDEMVAPPSEEEKYAVFILIFSWSASILSGYNRAIYENLDYSIEDVEESAGGPIALSSDKSNALMGRMRYPSLSLHGIEGDACAKTVIPAKVTGTFSIRYEFPLGTAYYISRFHSDLSASVIKSRTTADTRLGETAGVQIRRRRVQETWDEEYAYD